VILGYQPTLREVQPPMQPGSILGLNGPVQVPIYQQWYALRFSPKKLLIPADWHDKPGDDAPWLGMRFRMPLTVAIREKLVPPNFEGSTARDEHVLTNGDKPGEEASGTKYIDGQMLFYKATVFDPRRFTRSCIANSCWSTSWISPRDIAIVRTRRFCRMGGCRRTR
jgi:hypothetical protein